MARPARDPARLVGVKAKIWTHAVWVPHDLVPPPALFGWEQVDREGRGPLVRLAPSWVGAAECGQRVRGVVAGPHRGHDWDSVPSLDRCPRCTRAIDKEGSS